MSIGKFQDKFLNNKGCMTVMAVGMAGVFLFFGWTQSCGRSQLTGQPEQNQAVVTVGDVPVTDEEITAIVTRMSSQDTGPTAPPPTYQGSVRFETEALTDSLNQAAQYYLAEQNHIPMTDAALMAAATEAMEPQVEQEKMQLMISGKVKPNATPKETDDAFKKATGMTPDDFIKENLARIKDRLNDSAQRTEILGALAPVLLQQAMADKMAPTDAVLKASYDNATLKRIFISSAKGADAAGKAKAALAAIKGGMSFDAAMDKFSSDPAPPGKGKKPSDATQQFPLSSMDSNPEFKSLAGQKAGFVSGVIDDPMGKAIYEIVSIKNDAPKDLQTNIVKYRRDYSQAKVQAEIQKQTKAVLASNAIKWDNDGYKALFAFTQANEITDPAKKKAALSKVVDEAKAARNGSPMAAIYATYAWFAAFDALYNAPGADKGAMRDQRIEVLTATLQNTEDYDLRMELADLYTQKKDGADALTNLVSAAKSNMQYDATGQRRFGDIAAKGSLLVAQKLVTAEQVKQLDTAQADWRKGKEESDKDAADQQAQMAQNSAQAKVDAENDKKNMELLEKQKQANKPNTPPPAPPAAPSKGAASPPPPTAKQSGPAPTKP